MSKHLFKSTMAVGGMTFFSRVLGFVRDMLVANLFGVNAATDAFFVAFRIPNMLRRLFTEGAFAHAFVPILAEYRETGSHEALKGFIDRSAGTLAGILLFMTGLGTLAAPLVIVCFAPGFIGDTEQFAMATDMLRITLPYLFFISLVAFAGGILNAHARFMIPALTPAILNVTMIVAAIWVAPELSEPITSLAWGVFVGGVLQLLFQIPVLIKLRLLPKPRWAYRDKAVQRLMKLMLPAIFGVSVVQVNFLIGTLVASFLEPGSVSWLYYSDRLVEFPLGILGVAVATVILPNLSKHHVVDDSSAFSSALDWGLRLVLLVGLPATIGLMMLSEPVLTTLFQYNEFSAEDVHMAAKSLRAYSLGLLAFMLIKVLVPGFTARQDTKSPVRFGMYAVACNLVLNLVLIVPFAHAGVAWAATLAACLNAVLLLYALLRSGVYQPGAGWLYYNLRILVANAMLGLYLHYFVDQQAWLDRTLSQRGLQLAVAVGLAMLIYAMCLLVLGLRTKHLVLQSASAS